MESSEETQVMIADATGFHIYADLHLTLELSAATEESKADLYLEILEDYARIASDFSLNNPKLLLFEVQGERIHLFQNLERANPNSLRELISFASYFTDAVFTIIKPKAQQYWDGFCMAADFGRAIILSTGQDGDDSLISLGSPANAPAKRLARTPQVRSGCLAIKSELVQQSLEFRDAQERYAVGDWVEINVKDRPRRPDEKLEKSLFVEAVESSRRVAAEQGRKRVLLAEAAEIVKTGSATINNPMSVQAFLMRADLDGFSLGVQAAFAQGTEDAIKRLVLEFLQIMRLPEAFESHLNRPLIRLPWAGDCYCAIFLPKDYEEYTAIRSYLPATLALAYFDPEGEVNAKRATSLAAVANRCAWSIGVAGGEESDGRLLVANIETRSRRFLVAAGWGARHSLDAQNATGLGKSEAAIHDEDYPKLDPNYQEAFNRWKEGPTIYRKATAAGLRRAKVNALLDKRVYMAPRQSEIIVPRSRPYYGEWD
jgi:hypothetical protein